MFIKCNGEIRTSLMATLSQEPTAYETIANLGIYLQAYATMRTLQMIDPRTLFSFPEDWHTYVKDQVLVHPSAEMNLSTAYNLMERQNNKCKRCNSDLMLSREPILLREVKSNTFFGRKNKWTIYSWNCASCCELKKRCSMDRMDRLNRLDEKIDLYTKEEYVGVM
jgi:hypothetical protein